MITLEGIASNSCKFGAFVAALAGLCAGYLIFAATGDLASVSKYLAASAALVAVLVWLYSFLGYLVLSVKDSVVLQPAQITPVDRYVDETSDVVDHFSGMSASRVAQTIREYSISCSYYVESAIARLCSANYELNCVTSERFELARAEARQVDAALAGIKAGDQDAHLYLESIPGRPSSDAPFLGVPTTIKECLAVEGLPQTGGHAPHDPRHARARASGHRYVWPRASAASDATAVARLRKAGFIVIGSTNLSELCLWYEASNPLHGSTSNPYDTNRTTGGSSGGEGAVVGAGVTPCGLGSDIGGSIRMPAHFCGVFGHKPTGGLVPNTGQLPFGATRLCTTGPISAHAEDLWPMLVAMAGSDGLDACCRARKLIPGGGEERQSGSDQSGGDSDDEPQTRAAGQVVGRHPTSGARSATSGGVERPSRSGRAAVDPAPPARDAQSTTRTAAGEVATTSEQQGGREQAVDDADEAADRSHAPSSVELEPGKAKRAPAGGRGNGKAEDEDGEVDQVDGQGDSTAAASGAGSGRVPTGNLFRQAYTKSTANSRDSSLVADADDVVLPPSDDEDDLHDTTVFSRVSQAKLKGDGPAGSQDGGAASKQASGAVSKDPETEASGSQSEDESQSLSSSTKRQSSAESSSSSSSIKPQGASAAKVEAAASSGGAGKRGGSSGAAGLVDEATSKRLHASLAAAGIIAPRPNPNGEKPKSASSSVAKPIRVASRRARAFKQTRKGKFVSDGASLFPLEMDELLSADADALGALQELAGRDADAIGTRVASLRAGQNVIQSRLDSKGKIHFEEQTSRPSSSDASSDEQDSDREEDGAPAAAVDQWSLAVVGLDGKELAPASDEEEDDDPPSASMNYIGSSDDLLRSPLQSCGIAQPGVTREQLAAGSLKKPAQVAAWTGRGSGKGRTNPPHALRTMPGTVSAHRHVGYPLLPVRKESKLASIPGSQAETHSNGQSASSGRRRRRRGSRARLVVHSDSSGEDSDGEDDTSRRSSQGRPSLHLGRQGDLDDVDEEDDEVSPGSSGWGEQPVVDVPGTPADVDLRDIEVLLPAQLFHPDASKRVTPPLTTPVDDRYRKAVLLAARRLVDRCGCKGPNLVHLPGWELQFDLWQGMLADDRLSGFYRLYSSDDAGVITCTDRVVALCTSCSLSPTESSRRCLDAGRVMCICALPRLVAWMACAAAFDLYSFLRALLEMSVQLCCAADPVAVATKRPQEHRLSTCGRFCVRLSACGAGSGAAWEYAGAPILTSTDGFVSRPGYRAPVQHPANAADKQAPAAGAEWRSVLQLPAGLGDGPAHAPPLMGRPDTADVSGLSTPGTREIGSEDEEDAEGSESGPVPSSTSGAAAEGGTSQQADNTAQVSAGLRGRWSHRCCRTTFPALGLALIETVFSECLPWIDRRARRVGRRARYHLSKTLRKRRAVVLVPTHPTPAPVHGLALFRPTNAGYTAYFNAMQTPVTQVPIGFLGMPLSLDEDGAQGALEAASTSRACANARKVHPWASLPVGMSVVGPIAHDHWTIAVALALERRCGAGWVPPPLAGPQAATRVLERVYGVESEVGALGSGSGGENGGIARGRHACSSGHEGSRASRPSASAKTMQRGQVQPRESGGKASTMPVGSGHRGGGGDSSTRRRAGSRARQRRRD